MTDLLGAAESLVKKLQQRAEKNQLRGKGQFIFKQNKKVMKDIGTPVRRDSSFL
jgi:hypothetical protein